MAASVPQAVQSCHELLLWLIPQLDKFPRVRWFSGTGDSAKGLAGAFKDERMGALCGRRGRMILSTTPIGGVRSRAAQGERYCVW